jgi:hypothetical protein
MGDLAINKQTGPIGMGEGGAENRHAVGGRLATGLSIAALIKEQNQRERGVVGRGRSWSEILRGQYSGPGGIVLASWPIASTC